MQVKARHVKVPSEVERRKVSRLFLQLMRLLAPCVTVNNDLTNGQDSRLLCRISRLEKSVIAIALSLLLALNAQRM